MQHTKTIRTPKAQRRVRSHKTVKPIRSTLAAFKSHGRRLIELSDEVPVLYHHFTRAYVALTNGGQKTVEQFVEDEEETLSTRIDGRPAPIVPFYMPLPIAEQPSEWFEEAGFGLWLRGATFSLWLIPVEWQRQAATWRTEFCAIEGRLLSRGEVTESDWRLLFGHLPFGVLLGSLQNYRTSVLMIDEFLERGAEVKDQESAAKLIDTMLERGWNSGDMSIYFRDRVYHVENCQKILNG